MTSTMAASEPSIPPLSTSIGTDEDEYYMQEALKVARSALDVGEVPVGCVIVLPTPQGPCIVSHGATQINTARDATRHAEIVAIDRMLASGSSSDQLKLLPTVFAKPARPESLSEASPLLTWKEDQDNSRFEQKSQDKWVNEPNDLDHWSNSYGWGSGRSFAVDILSQCTLYVTCEPCTMCAAALAQVGMGKVVFGCENDKFDGCGSLLHLHKDLAWTTADCMSQQSMPQWQSLRNRSESDGHVTSSLPPHTPHRRASRIRCESDGDVTPALPSFTTHRQSLRNRSESDGYVTPSSPSFLSPEESANGDDEGKNASKRLTKDQQPWRLKISGKKVVSLLMLSVVAVVVCDTLFAAPDKRLIQPDFSDVFLQWVQAHPTKGLAAIMIVIAGAVVFMVPIGTALALGCGYIYTGAYGWKLGLAIATAVSMGGSSLGAVTCFLVGRHLMRDQVRTWIKMYPLFVAIDIAAAEHGLRIMAMLYLTPILPLGPVSYMCGTTSMALSSFVLARIASLPLMFLYSFVGASTGALAGGKSGNDGEAIKEIEGNQTLIVSGILFSILMVAGITRYIKKELNYILDRQKRHNLGQTEEDPEAAVVEMGATQTATRQRLRVV